MDVSQWRPKTSDIPTSPGVYRYWDKTNKVIYVGKAKNLRNRLTSYFTNIAELHPRTAQMIQTAVRVDWVMVETEVEALQLEHTWINEYNPRFNVRFRDDKSYPWLAITLKDEFPRIMVVRGDRKVGIKYFGPYVQAWQIRETIDRLLRVFPIRTCSEVTFKRAAATNRPCLLGYIEKCAAPCVDRINADDHRELVNGFVKLLDGDSKKLIKTIKSQMVEASDKQEYELAGRYRDDLASIEAIAQKSAVILEVSTNADLIAISEDELAAGIQIFHVRSGRITGQRGFIADKPENISPSALMTRVLMQIYSEDGGEVPPNEILVSVEPEEIEIATDWLSLRANRKISVKVPQKAIKRDLLDTCLKNAASDLQSYRARRGADIAARSQALTEVSNYLELEEIPLRIECIDVSHLDGQNVVASLVVFEDGLPIKRDYKRYKMQHGQGNNDVLSISEVVERRFKRVEEEDVANRKGFAYPPQLLVVDGGKPQVNAASSKLFELGIDIPVIGIAKRLEEIWKPEAPTPVIFPRNSEGLFLLQRVRDEAHRFAISFQRSKQRGSLMNSLLDEIPNLGEKRKKDLLKHFGSVKKLRSASVEEIAACPGLGEVLAASVHAHLAALPAQISVNVSTGEISEGA
jgi:excinuclease ABC subunit C